MHATNRRKIQWQYYVTRGLWKATLRTQSGPNITALGGTRDEAINKVQHQLKARRWS